MRVVKAYQEFVKIMDRYRKTRSVKLCLEYNKAYAKYSHAVDLYLKHLK